MNPMRTSPVTPGQGVVLCTIKDELPLLPHFLRHYRGLGARRFAFVDNGSSDGTLGFLLDQPDCDVFQHPGDYRSALYGMNWKNHLLRRYADASWRLSVDADEHAVYAGWPAISLDEFSARLGRSGRSAVTAVMVDMYGSGPIVGTRIQPSRDLIEDYPYFDGDGYSIAMPQDWRLERFPRLDIRGGPIERLYASSGKGWLAKTPLLLEPEILFNDPHTVLPVSLNFSLPEIALLHFRFTELLTRRTGSLPTRAYTRGSSDSYQSLGLSMRDNPGFTLFYPGSVRFESVEQFRSRCVIQDSLLRPES